MPKPSPSLGAAFLWSSPAFAGIGGLDMDPEAADKIHDEMIQRILAGSIEQATDEELASFLMALCHRRIPNEQVRHRAIIQGITINHIQMARVIRGVQATMQSLNDSNDRTQRWFLFLTVVATILGIIQVLTGVLALCH